jgi:alkylhydroperoxidase family enzyme
MRLLANFPVAGKRQVAALLAAERQLDLSDLTRARLAWVIARQNCAWYGLSEAQSRLESLGQSAEQIAELERFESVDSERNLTSRDRALLTVAKKLAASPVQLTDAEAQRAIELAGPREFVQAVHYTAMRSLLDRFTEASGLPID